MKTLALIGLICLCQLSLSSAAEWKLFDGQVREGSPKTFDFETKTLTIENSDTLETAALNTKDLDLGSKRRLLFSGVFHQSFPEGFMGFSVEKLWLFGIAILSPILLLVIGMWLSALFIARKFNPFSAIGAFLGSWIAGAILVACYLVFAQKAEGSAAGILWFGGILATIVMALFIAAIYKTGFFKGLFIFLAHIALAILLGYILVFGAEKIFPNDTVTEVWDTWVFSKVGLIEERSRIGY